MGALQEREPRSLWSARGWRILSSRITIHTYLALLLCQVHFQHFTNIDWPIPLATHFLSNVIPPLFRDKENETQRDGLTCLKSHS